jgi:hypothetical protein
MGLIMIKIKFAFDLESDFLNFIWVKDVLEQVNCESLGSLDLNICGTKRFIVFRGDSYWFSNKNNEYVLLDPTIDAYELKKIIIRIQNDHWKSKEDCLRSISHLIKNDYKKSYVKTFFRDTLFPKLIDCESHLNIKSIDTKTLNLLKEPPIKQDIERIKLSAGDIIRLTEKEWEEIDNHSKIKRDHCVLNLN